MHNIQALQDTIPTTPDPSYIPLHKMHCIIYNRQLWTSCSRTGHLSHMYNQCKRILYVYYNYGCINNREYKDTQKEACEIMGRCTCI